MKNIYLVTLYTLREAMARKVFIFFAGISTLVLVGLVIIFSILDINTLLSSVKQGGTEAAFGDMVGAFEYLIVSPLTGLCLLLAIFSSASFVPNMMEKGNIDLLLSKPVSRNQLLLGKYFGGILVVFLNVFFLILGTWIIVSVKFGYWNYSFLIISLTITFTFAVLYSLIVFLGVLTRSPVLGMMVAYLIYIILSPLLFAYKEKLHILISGDIIKAVLNGLYYIIPQTSELTGKMSFDLAAGNSLTNYQPVLTSLIFLILLLSFSMVLFRKKDF